MGPVAGCAEMLISDTCHRVRKRVTITYRYSVPHIPSRQGQ